MFASTRRAAYRRRALQHVETLEPRHLLAANPVILEFQASNNGTLTDGDGNSSDWIELYNAGDEAANLQGWHLTDDANDLTKWTLPSVTLAPGELLVVFASGQASDTYVDAGGKIHANFTLDPDGEYLALVQPDGTTVASEFDPEYPPQFRDVSYGAPFTTAETVLVPENAPAQVLIPPNGTLGSTWTSNAFTPGAGWITESSPGVPARTGIGFETESGSPDLMAHWPLNEPAGTAGAGSVIDLAGGQNGTPFGGLIFGAGGANPGTGTSVDGTTGGVRVSHTSALNPESFTISVWVRPDTNVGVRDIVSSSEELSGGAVRRGFSLRVSTPQIRFITGDGTNWDTLTGPLVIPSQWIHLAATYDATTATKSLYVNGVLSGSTTAHGYVPNLAQDLHIAAGGNTGTTNFFDGRVDDVAVFNTALDPVRISGIYAGGVPAGGADFISEQVRTNVAGQMLGQGSSAYVRVPFAMDAQPDFDRLVLQMKYDDGFVAYLNGQEVARHNAPVAAAWNSLATGNRPDAEAVEYREFDISSAIAWLTTGDNVLAIHGLNAALDDPDFLVAPRLVGLNTTIGFDTPGYFLTPSPGETNATVAVDVGPFVSNVEHSPHQPVDADELVVTAKIERSATDIGPVSLIYRRMYNTEIRTVMNDNGTGNDLVAGDGVYTGTIPASAASPGEMLRYYIEAADVAGNVMRNPRIEDTTGTDRDPEYYGTVVADPAVNSGLPVLEWFAANPSAGNTRAGTRASVYYNGAFYDNIFVRQRGQATNSGVSQKFNFNDDQPFYVNPKLGRVLEFNLNGQGSDAGYIRQALAHETFTYVGAASSEAFLTRVEVNGSFQRVGIWLEQVDEDFLARNGIDNDGALYKFVQRSTLNPVFSDTTTGIEKKTRLDEDFSDVQALVNGLNLPTLEQRRQFVFDNLDLPQIMNYLAVRAVIQDADDIRKNFYMYRDTDETQLWSIYPWDKDFTYGVVGDGGPNLPHPFFGEQEHLKLNANQWNVLLDVLFGDPVTQEMYLRRLRTVMDQVLQSPDTPIEDRLLERRVDEMLAAASGDLSASAVNSALTVKNYLTQRRNDLFVTHSVDNQSTGGEITTIIPEFVNNVRYFVPSNDSVNDWTGLSEPANIAAWPTGQMGLGYESSPADYATLIRTPVRPGDTCGVCTNIFVRIPFTVDDPSAMETLTLRMKYDDGFVAYINGTEVARANVVGTPTYLTSAANHDDASAVLFENFNISSAISLLQPGQNILALRAINQSVGSSDMLVSASLIEGIIGADDVAGIPHAQAGNPAVTFSQTDFDADPDGGNQDEEYIKLENPTEDAVDISGWRLEGGIRHTFAPGTVIPSGSSLYVTPNITDFRSRTTGPAAGQTLLVQGNYSGHLSNLGETVQLIAADGTLMDTLVVPPATSDLQRYLRVSEINYNPAGDDAAGEFIELTNTSSGVGAMTLDLSGVVVAEGPSVPFTFPAGTELAPGEFLILVANRVAFLAAHPQVPAARIAGEFSGGLSNSGERIKIEQADGNTIFEVTYADSGLWPVAADGVGASLVLRDPESVTADTMDKHYSWRASTEFGGSPGAASAQPVGIVINELRASSNGEGELGDAIELLNVSTTTIDISGWYLSDNDSNLTKFRIPDGTVLAAGATVVFTEQDFNPTPSTPSSNHFALDGTRGEDVWLVTMDEVRNVTGFVDQVHFDASFAEQTWGRVAADASYLVPQARPTLGAVNLHPMPSGVVISEVNYHSSEPSAAALVIDQNITADELEFVEIHNAMQDSISLEGWRLRGGINYDFATSQVLGPGASLLVVPFNVDNATRMAAFRTHYGLASSVTIVGGYADRLSDSGEVVSLEAPDASPPDDPTYVPHVTVDEVRYDDLAPWPVEADGTGQTLARQAPSYWGGFARSWQSAAPSPGVVDFSGNVDGDLDGDGFVSATDINLLYDAINGDLSLSYFDLDRSATVDQADVTYLIVNLMDTQYGDANLDGSVDVRDFNRWNAHKFVNSGRSWADGDYSGDARVDAADFNIWFSHRFESNTVAAASSPRTPRTPRAALAAPRATAISTISVDKPGLFRPDMPQSPSDNDEAVLLKVVVSRAMRRGALTRRGVVADAWRQDSGTTEYEHVDQVFETPGDWLPSPEGLLSGV